MNAPEQPTPPNRQIEDRWAAKLWLWKNGDHYLAFDSEVPTYGDGDPKTLGEPVGYALLEWETYNRMTEQVAAQRAAEAVAALRCAACDGPYPNPDCGHLRNARDMGERIPCTPCAAATPPPGDVCMHDWALVMSPGDLTHCLKCGAIRRAL